jgi:methanogenic corrinoid protein MtbC1
MTGHNQMSAALLEQSARGLASAAPALFVDAVKWSLAAFASREVPEQYIQASLESLRTVVVEELPEQAGELSREYLEKGLDGLSAEVPQVRLEGTTPEGKLALEYLAVALEGDRDRAVEMILEAAKAGTPPVDLFTRVLAPAQREVGALWHRGEVSVSHEHFVTESTRTAMALLAQGNQRKPSNGKSVLVAVAPGNAHTLGAQALAYLFEIEGWRSLHLGEAMPAAELGVAVAAFDAELLALSIALSPQLRSAKEAVRAVRFVRPDVKILVGGPLLDKVPGVWREVDADAGAANVEQALARAAELVGGD